MKNKEKTYVVFVCRQPGIYGTWEEAKENVDKFPKNKHQSFGSRDETEIAWLDFQEKRTASPIKELAEQCASSSKSSTGCHGASIEHALEERDRAVKERDQAVKEREQAMKERDQALEKLSRITKIVLG